MIRLAWFAACSALLAPQEPGAVGERATALVRELDGAGPERAEAILAELESFGAEAALAALGSAADPLASHPIGSRRWRARLARTTGAPSAIAPALVALADPDPGVRFELVRLLVSPRLGAERAADRAAAFARLAQADLDSTVRDAAIDALARLDQPEAAAALAGLLAAPPAEAEAAARALAEHPRGAQEVVRAVQRAFEARGKRPAFAEETLALLLGRGYGRALAELASGGAAPEDLAPFVLGASHPSPDVRAAAASAVEDFAARCRGLGDVERGLSVLAALQKRGLDDYALLAERAKLALAVAADPAPALEAARSMRAMLGTGGERSTRERRAAAALLEAGVLVALDRAAEAESALAAASRDLEALARERFDLALDRTPEAAPRSACEAEIELWQRRALVELYRALALIAQGRESTHPLVLERARAADLHLLEAQIAGSNAWPPRSMSIDDLLLHSLGPVPVVFASTRNRVLDRGRALDLERGLCEAMAAVSGGAVPGFARPAIVAERLADPVADPERKVALARIQTTLHAAVLEEIGRRIDELGKDDAAPDPEQVRDLELRRRYVQLEQQKELAEGDPALRRLRAPSQAASILAARWIEHGRTAAARTLAERARADFEAARDVASGIDLERALARIESTLGSALMNLDAPQEAERVLLRALERLDAVEKELEVAGARSGGLSFVRDQRAGVLITLAVNANVKQRDQDKALAFFERAFALDQSDFMRVLLACYRARAGRTAEAWEALERAPVQPQNFYNLGCTYALLGERDLALDFVRRDLDELRGSEGARERQKEWARGDPDLASLRGDPRFERLVAPGAAK